ncbi:thioesterase domain-containing protein [Ignatzschineria rhizosphaerae]|uniref:Thioesterase domain-containing protein n=1 Tax=Ignatzschineria rhizosphaerae TaxID=2923279 RepID=A0ABY3X6J2_9GAMM|nr:YiiD C-terminal domain-containing protein [Ignatzschineria rhizosphaerae]UNM97510.1 thioesterase domain-containing protein [Ignatzschineria rhizosphaerae]
MELNHQDSSAVCEYLSQWLPREIPISASLGVIPIEWKEKTLKLHVPLENNRNHMYTGFGGSLYTSALLVGWSWLHLQLKALGHEKNLHIVIQQANIQYPKPMKEDGIAICRGVDEKAWVKFEKMFNKFGKGRLEIQTEVVVGSEVTTSFTGDFVAYMADKS